MNKNLIFSSIFSALVLTAASSSAEIKRCTTGMSVAGKSVHTNGTGTSSDPFVICNPDQLAELSLPYISPIAKSKFPAANDPRTEDYIANITELYSYGMESFYVLGADLDMNNVSKKPFKPIPKFYGAFDGQGFSIHNLTFDYEHKSDSRLGQGALFTRFGPNASQVTYIYQSPAALKNLNLISPKLTVRSLTPVAVGAVVGSIGENTELDKVLVFSPMITCTGSESTYCAGIAGQGNSIGGGFLGSRIKRSAVIGGSIVAPHAAGVAFASDLSEVYSSARVEGVHTAAGLTGELRAISAFGYESIVDSYSVGTVIATGIKGSAAGITSTAYSTVDRTYSMASVYGNSAGGLKINYLADALLSNSFFGGRIDKASTFVPNPLIGALAAEGFKNDNRSNFWFADPKSIFGLLPQGLVFDGVLRPIPGAEKKLPAEGFPQIADRASLFKSSTTNPALKTWDFVKTWKAQAGTAPTLRNVPSLPIPTSSPVGRH